MSSSGYRYKTSSPYAEFIVRERGIADHPNLTVEVESTYNEEFVNALKAALRHGSERAWEPELKRWFSRRRSLNESVRSRESITATSTLVEGDKITDLITGQASEQTGLF